MFKIEMGGSAAHFYLELRILCWASKNLRNYFTRANVNQYRGRGAAQRMLIMLLTTATDTKVHPPYLTNVQFLVLPDLV
jgi:hypothetical protein